ncbi:MAG: lysophospholipid acyltransferase family protein [Bdellovibrionota bacterium]
MKSFFGGKGSKNDIPHFLLDIVRKYFRLEVEGIENVPRKGRCLIVPNHSGVTALDAVMVANEIQRSLRRIPRILAHPLWFVGPNIRILAKRMGLEEANKDAGETLLRKEKAVMIFPEGAAGNFKPTSDRYHLQEFRRGFVRMAMATKAPIVPVVVIGAEETNINLSSIPLTKVLKGTIIPIPLNVIPLPAKWKIIFLPPISMKKYSKKDAANHDLVHSVSESVKAQIQTRINAELAKREWIYFPTAKSKKN